MKRLALVAPVVLLALALACCSKPSQLRNEIAEKDCGQLPRYFVSTNNKDWWQSLPPAIDFLSNVILVEKGGYFQWNGTRIEEQKLDEYLYYTSRMNPVVPTSIDFSARTPCASILRVRALMRKHLQCDQQQKCFQGKWPTF